MIRLRQTASEFLLFLPKEQRERAKHIEGWRWDANRKCWVFPRTRAIWAELLQEFGDDAGLSRANIERNDPKPAGKEIANPSEQANLDQAASDPSGILALIDRLTEKEIELQRVKSEMKQLEIERAQLAAREQDREPALGVPEALDALLQVLFPGDESLPKLKVAIQRDVDLPIQLGRGIERDLRSALRETAPASLHDLITAARESGLLSDEAVDFAHVIRRQRNRRAHSDSTGISDTDHRGSASILATNLMCVAATRLFLTELRRGRARGEQ